MTEPVYLEELSRKQLIDELMDRFDATVVLGFNGGKIARDDCARNIYISRGLSKSQAISFMADSISLLSDSPDDIPEREPFE